MMVFNDYLQHIRISKIHMQSFMDLVDLKFDLSKIQRLEWLHAILNLVCFKDFIQSFECLKD